ncbi:MAG TPA: hypothetical protein VJZ71_11700 [Phycisphaerae bacterium]|nr:hypothetical protein [Phycisphaerae bacterium]
MQHHIEEFSVADVRHTLAEVWRVIAARRWCFLFPFLAVATLAFTASLWVPRKYSATTVIKREHDPVLASMMGKAWSEPYAEIRQRMAAELTHPDLIQHVLAELDLPEGLSRFENGELTPDAQAAQKEMAEEIAQGLATKSLEASPNRDVVALTLVLSDRSHQAAILRELRDQYIARTKKRTIEVMRGVEAFLLTQSERCRTELAEHQRNLVELEYQFPGIDPVATDPTLAQEAVLLHEKVDLERQLQALEAQFQQWTDRLAHSCVTANGTPDGRPIRLPQAPNPQYLELRQQIEKLERELTDAKSVRMMTNEHPIVVELHRSLAARRSELGQTPVTVDRSAPVISGPDGPMAAAQNAEFQLADLEARLQSAESRHREVSYQIAKIQDGRILAGGRREEYLGIKQKSDRAREEMATWTQHLGPLRRVVTLESDNRGIHFSTVQDVVAEARPQSPDALLVMAACLAIGAAAGGLSVLVRELMDRSFRTVKHLSTSLGIPVIESIDEIMTQTSHRRRLIRTLVTVPAAAALMLSVTSATGVMAYLSLKDPIGYERVKSTPTSVVEVLLEQK